MTPLIGPFRVPLDMSDAMANLAVGSAVLLAGVSLILAVVGFLAYRRVQHGRLAWIALAFLGFTFQGVYLAWTAYQERGEIDSFPVLPVLNLLIVVALYLAVLKR